MKLSCIRVQNYRSIVDTGDVRVEPLQALVGENNAGKSNLLRAIEALLTAGAGNVQETTFFSGDKPIVITATFSDLSKNEQTALRRYLRGDTLIIEKQFTLVMDVKSGKNKVATEYHGYIAEPKDWWLSTEKAIAQEGPRPDWKKIAEEHDLLAYVQQPDGKVTKKSYEEGLQRALESLKDIEYDLPVLSPTEALGFQQVLVKYMPRFYLLPAITDYTSEIDRRSSTTIFRRLMADLAERIIKTDARYGELESSLKKIRYLFNSPSSGEVVVGDMRRLDSLDVIEGNLKKHISRLMPSVQAIRVEVNLEDTNDFFSRGVALKVDDGILTDVLEKGHGLQRSVVFGLLQNLIESQRSSSSRPIILAIEEPELYIHPQMQRLVFRVLRDFAQTDQVIYTTHSPSFVDLTRYNCVGVVKKSTTANGTKVSQCPEDVFGSPDDKKTFKLLNSFGLEHNQMFFAQKIILVEGDQDVMAIIATAKKLGYFQECPEEIGYTIVNTSSKGEIPKFQRMLNAFSLPYVVLHEMDGKDFTEPANKQIIDALGTNACVQIPQKLEHVCGVGKHFDSDYHAKVFFSNAANITPDLEVCVKALFS